MNWPPSRDSKADVSSASPSLEQIEELWVVCGPAFDLVISRKICSHRYLMFV